jgi:hypothetical protein
MNIPAFSIEEWLVCPKCEFLSDAPFHPAANIVHEPWLMLGKELPETVSVPDAEWQTEVSASCPGCGHRIRAMAGFQGRRLSAFTAVTTT